MRALKGGIVLDSLLNIIVVPFAWLLKQLYLLTNNYGVALILFALITKIVLLYFSFKGKRGMMQTQRMQPKQAELQKKFGSDKVKYQEAVQQLYKDEGVSMSSGCLWTLLPFPIVIALFGIIREPFTYMMGLAQNTVNQVLQVMSGLGLNVPGYNTYSQLMATDLLHQHFATVQLALPNLTLMDINYNFLGLNLAKTPTLGLDPLLIIPILSGVSSYLTMYFSTKFNKTSAAMQKQNRLMNLMMPAFSVYIAFIMPAIIGLYWFAQNVFGIVQDYYLTRYYNKIFAAEDAKRAELEARRKAAEDAMKEEQRQRRAAAIEAKKQKRKPGQTVYKVKSKPPVKNTDLPSEE